MHPPGKAKREDRHSRRAWEQKKGKTTQRSSQCQRMPVLHPHSFRTSAPAGQKASMASCAQEDSEDLSPFLPLKLTQPFTVPLILRC